jgi:hypothetical protein
LSAPEIITAVMSGIREFGFPTVMVLLGVIAAWLFGRWAANCATSIGAWAARRADKVLDVHCDFVAATTVALRGVNEEQKGQTRLIQTVDQKIDQLPARIAGAG